MIRYLYGADSYRRQEKIKEYTERYKNKYSVKAENFDLAKDGEFSKLSDFCKSQSLFELHKLGVVGGFSELSDKEFKEFIILVKDVLKNKDTTLILTGDKKPVKEFAFLSKEKNAVEEFGPLEGAELKKFLDSEIERRGLELDEQSRNMLLSSYEKNAWEIISILDKLALLDEKIIDLKILEKHIDLLPTINIFNFLNKLRSSPSIGEKLRLLEDLLRRDVDPAMVFNLMAASPYLTQEEKIKMADYDAAIKTGKLEYVEVLTDIVLE